MPAYFIGFKLNKAFSWKLNILLPQTHTQRQNQVWLHRTHSKSTHDQNFKIPFAKAFNSQLRTLPICPFTHTCSAQLSILAGFEKAKNNGHFKLDKLSSHFPSATRNLL